jgi:hypothetical protein
MEAASPHRLADEEAEAEDEAEEVAEEATGTDRTTRTTETVPPPPLRVSEDPSRATPTA